MLKGLLFLAFGGALVSTAASAYEYRLCNDNDFTVGYSLVHLMNDQWQTDGWYSLGAGQCDTENWALDTSPVFVRGEAHTQFWAGDYLFCVDDAQDSFLFAGTAFDSCASSTQYKAGFFQLDGIDGGVAEYHFNQTNAVDLTATVQACNHTDVEVYVALGYRKGYWAPTTIEAWQAVAAGECRAIQVPSIDGQVLVMADNQEAGLSWQSTDEAEQHCINGGAGFTYVNPDLTQSACNLEGQRLAKFFRLTLDDTRTAHFDINADDALHLGTGTLD